MVRRTSRLPPNGKSLEEVMVQRLASGASDVATREKQRPSVLPSSTNMVHSVTTAMERIESMATELTQLNDRLGSLAMPAAVNRKISARTSTVRPAASMQIDQYITDSMNDLYAAYATRQATKPSRTSHVTYDPAHGAHVDHTVRDLRATVRRLDKVFDEVATGDKQRHLAATKIATLVRGFIMRRRCRKMKYALGQWRARRCGTMLTCLEQFSAREEFLHGQIQRMELERQVALLRRVLAELRDVTLLNLPLRRKQAEETEQRFRRKQYDRVRVVWRAWKGSALGPRSRRRVTADAKVRHAAARQRLEMLERFDVITTEMVHDEFLKENIRVVRMRHPFWVLKTYFGVLLHDEYLPMKQKLACAIAHDRKKRLGRVWYAWLPVFRSAQVDRAMSRTYERRTLERYDKHYNLRRIDAHYRATHARKHLRAWARYGQRLRRVRKLFEDNTKTNMITLLQRWHVRARYQRELRAAAVEAWKAYCRRIFQTPFRVWYNYTAARRADRRAKESICIAYQRRARRHTKYTFFRLWKHQVLFGTIEGIHSKLHLLRSLEDQKRLCLGLEHNATLYQQNIQALQQTIHSLEQQLTTKQHELLTVHDATQATRFSVHAAEQSIARVQGMLEAVRQVHPGTLARIEKMFGENPLLTQDLHDVVALHVAKRREVLDKLSLDDDELEIQNASHAPLDRADQLLLHRVKWVFSRLDLAQDTPRERHDAQRSEAAMDQLCALFEFIRHGETTKLTKDNDPSHPRRQEDKGDPGPVDRADLLSATETWHAFLQALTVRFAPDRMLQLQERLVKRADELHHELEELKANPHIYNAYSSSGQPHT